MSFLRWLIANHPFANVTFVVVLFVGLLAYLGMPREQDPEINFNWVNILTVLPGASAEDIEQRVTTPLEDAIQTVADIRFIASNSREDVSSILVRFRDIPENDFNKRVTDLRREVQNKADSELPPEIEDPQVIEITTSNGFPTAVVLVTGQSDDETLRREAAIVKEDLERMSGVDKLYASGLHDPELQVEFDPQRLAARGLTAIDVADTVRAWFRDTAAGRVRVGGDEWLVRLLGTDSSPEYLAGIDIGRRGGQGQADDAVPLEAVAFAARGREKAQQLVSLDGRAAVSLAVTKKSYTNTLQLVERIRGYIDEKNLLLDGSGVRLLLADDQTVPTRNAIGIMERNAVIGLTLVVLVSWVFLGSRIAMLIGLGIPFSLAGAFWVLNVTGFTVNISVLLGIVIVLGMLVDDAVVVVEAIYYRMQRGAEALQAAVDSLQEVMAPVTSAVLTTMAAFLPLMLLPGIVGKFMFVIPFVVTVALAISLVEAYWMLPVHVVAARIDFRRPSRLHGWRTRFTHSLRVKYARLLLYVMRRPLRHLGIAALALALALAAIASGAVRMQFFAFDPIRLFYVNVDMPPGASLSTTLARAEEVAARVREHLREGEARSVTANAGIKFTETEPLYGDAYGQVMVALNPRGPGMREVMEVIDDMRADVVSLPGPGELSFLPMSGGPPLQKPVNIKVRGEDYTELRAAANAVKAVVRQVPGARDVADDDVPGRQELRLVLDAEAIHNAGLDAATVARLLRLHVDGEIVADMRDAGEKLDVRVRGKRRVLQDVDELLADPVSLPGGGITTLGALVRAETGTGKGIIRHYNLRRTITVEADLDKTLTDTVEANRRIVEGWVAMKAQYPGVNLDFTGELDDINESLEAMKALFVLGLGLIYLILAAQFRSYWQPLLILSTVPLAFTGVTLGLLVSRNPLSLYTLYGVIALTGIAVNSAIVLIDAANRRRAAGMSVLHAAVYAARRRVVPIIITSLTTIAGLSSLAAGIGGKSLIWGPVASSIVWGLGFATVLTLFVVPLLYRLFMQRGQRLRVASTGQAAD